MKARRIPIIAFFVLSSLLIAGLAFAQPSDIAGHWAEKQISKWVEKGLAGGYPDGTFKPNREISRAEFVALTNRAFGIKNEADLVDFTDVKKGEWYYSDVAAAMAAGYISGYPDGTFQPNKPISRQEVASILSRLLNLEPTGEGLEKFKDAGQIPQWSRTAIGTVAKNRLMGGYPDNTFKPFKNITRAEAVVSLDRALSAKAVTTFEKAGTYGPAAGINTIAGNVVINAAGITLQNTIITGDLLLAEGIGEGDVKLKNVTVKGTTTIAGGGSNSVTFEDCNIPTVKVTKNGVRVVATGNTTVDVVELESGAILVEVEVTGPGFETVTVSKAVPKGTRIILSGNFEYVEVEAGVEEVEIEAQEGTIKKLTLNAPAKVTGSAKIEEANINADGVTIEQTPEDINVAEGISAEVGGKTVKGTTSSGGGGGGGGSGGNDTGDAPPEITGISGATLSGTTIVISDNPPDPSTVSVTVSEDCEMKLQMDSEVVAEWNLKKGENDLLFTTSASGTDFTKVFDVMLQNKIELSEMLDVVDVGNILNAAKDSEYRDEFYEDTLGDLFKIINTKVDKPETREAIYRSIDLQAIYEAADKDTQTKIRNAVDPALEVYNNQRDPDIDFNSFIDINNYPEILDEINNAPDLYTDFYQALDFTKLYDAIITCSNKDKVYNAINESNIINTLVDKADKDTLIQCALVIYTSGITSDIKNDILSSVHLHSLLSILSKHGVKIEFILTDSASNQTTYTVTSAQNQVSGNPLEKKST